MTQILLLFLLAVSATTFKYCDEAPRFVAIGSSTVFPIAELYARSYTDMDILPVVTSSGSSLGLRNLLTGAVDMGHSSRPLQSKDYKDVGCDESLVNDDGTASGECQGVMPVPVQVANDALAVVAHKDSSLDSLTLDDVISIFSGTSGDQYTYVIPDKLSGTYDFFIEVTGDAVDANLQGNSGFADDNALIQQLANTPNGIGWVGVGAVQNTSQVKVLTVDGVNPLTTTDFTNYKLYRPLFMYFDSNKGDQQYQDQLKKYLCDAIGQQGQQIVSDVGFVPLTSDQVSAETSALGCSSSSSSTFPTFDFGSEQFQFCKDVYPIVVTGSSTVYPVTSAIQNQNPNIFLLPTSGSSGSSVGIATFIAGGNNLAASSRPLLGKDYEAFDCDPSAIDDTGIASAVCQGRLPKSLMIGRDMLSIIVNPASTMTDVSLDDLKSIFVDASSGMTLCGADVQSGTRDFFEEQVGVITSTDFQGFANDSGIVNCVQSSDNAIGFVPVAYVQDQEGVKVLTVEGKDPFDDQADYPLSRPLFIIYDALPLAAENQDRKYMCGLLSEDGQRIVVQVGYVALASEEIDQELANNQLLCRFQDTFSTL